MIVSGDTKALLIVARLVHPAISSNRFFYSSVWRELLREVARKTTLFDNGMG